MRRLEPPTGHVYRRDGARRSTWYAKYRLPDGRQVQKRIGPAWTERGRPAAGHYTKRTAEAWLREILDEARRGTLPGLVQTGATFADAAAEFLRYVEHDRGCKPSTLIDYRSIIAAHLLPAVRRHARRGRHAGEDRATGARRSPRPTDQPLSNRTKNKLLDLLHGVFRRAQKVYGLPATRSPRSSATRSARAVDIEVFGVEEVYALVRAADLRAGRGDLPDRGVHRTAPRRAASRCAGATSTSPPRRSACVPATPAAR